MKQTQHKTQIITDNAMRKFTCVNVNKYECYHNFGCSLTHLRSSQPSVSDHAVALVPKSASATNMLNFRSAVASFVATDNFNLVMRTIQYLLFLLWLLASVTSNNSGNILRIISLMCSKLFSFLNAFLRNLLVKSDDFIVGLAYSKMRAIIIF